MEKMPRLTTEQRSNLVAYLDGELPEPEAKQIEQVLTKSPVVQHDVEMLERTWQMLDQLPRLAVSQEFTARTLSAVKLDEVPRKMTLPAWVSRLPKERFRRGAIAMGLPAALSLSAVGGYVIERRFVPDSSAELLENLPVIQNLDLYANVESVEFLKQLDRKVGSFEQAPVRR